MMSESQEDFPADILIHIVLWSLQHVSGGACRLRNPPMSSTYSDQNASKPVNLVFSCPGHLAQVERAFH